MVVEETERTRVNGFKSGTFRFNKDVGKQEMDYPQQKSEQQDDENDDSHDDSYNTEENDGVNNDDDTDRKEKNKDTKQVL